MMKSKERPINQHTVPQLLLRGFTDLATGEICVYDKLTDKVFKTGTAGIAAEKGFYDYKTEDGMLTIDPGLTRLEGDVLPILTRIVSNRSIAGLSDQDRKLLSHFVAVQSVRGNRIRHSFKSMNELMTEQFRKRGIDPTKVENFGHMTDEHARLL